MIDVKVLKFGTGVAGGVVDVGAGGVLGERNEGLKASPARKGTGKVSEVVRKKL